MACLPLGDLPLCPEPRTTARETGREGAGEVSRGHSSPTGRRAESSNARSRGEDSMSAEQQKGTTNHGGRGDGGTGASPHGPPQTLTVFDPQRALTGNWREQVCEPQNLVRAYRQVRSNQGKPGVDGMTVHELAGWLRKNSTALAASLLDGTYQPQPVRGVQIPKPGGGQRQLGIPVAVDRLVQQADHPSESGR